MAHLSIPLVRPRRAPWWRSFGRQVVSNLRTVAWLARRIVRQVKLR